MPLRNPVDPENPVDPVKKMVDRLSAWGVTPGEFKSSALKATIWMAMA